MSNYDYFFGTVTIAADTLSDTRHLVKAFNDWVDSLTSVKAKNLGIKKSSKENLRRQLYTCWLQEEYKG